DAIDRVTGPRYHLAEQLAGQWPGRLDALELERNRVRFVRANRDLQRAIARAIVQLHEGRARSLIEADRRDLDANGTARRSRRIAPATGGQHRRWERNSHCKCSNGTCRATKGLHRNRAYARVRSIATRARKARVDAQ